MSRAEIKRLRGLTRKQLLAMVKDSYAHTVEKNNPGYYDKGTLIEIIVSEAA